MKISQKQASLLAREIHAQLSKKKVYKISDVLKDKVKQFISKREQLQSSVKEAEALVQKHDSGLLNIVGKDMYRKVEAYYGLQRMVEKIEEKNMPTVSGLATKYSELYESIEGVANDFYNCDDCGITIHENDKCFASVLLPDKSHPNYEIQKPENWMNEYFITN